MYRVPDPGDTRIHELEKALVEMNDVAATLRPQPTTVRLLSEILHARTLELEFPLNVEIAINEWIATGHQWVVP
jgi:hypothetical protein